MTWTTAAVTASTWGAPADDSVVEQWNEPFPKITVSGKKLLRDGVEFKVWGLQPLYIRWMKDFYLAGGDEERADVVDHVRGAKEWGANTLRHYMDLWDFVQGSGPNDLSINTTAMGNFIYLLETARKHQLYMLIAGNNAWEPAIIPSWYDALSYEERWEIQAFFLGELASAVYSAGLSDAVLGYELSSEPGITTDAGAEWYSGQLNGSEWYFSQKIAKGIAAPDQPQVVRDWINTLAPAIRENDPGALVTIGLFSNYHGTAYFGPSNLDGLLDFIAPHMYPGSAGETIEENIEGMEEWASSSLPVVHGETIMWLTEEDNTEFLAGILPLVQGVITFYWGYPPEDFDLGNPVPPAPPDINVFAYAIHLQSLLLLGEYRDGFLPQEAAWLKLT